MKHLSVLTAILLLLSAESIAGGRGQQVPPRNPDTPNGQQQILISPETTVVTEYLTADGYPDYVAALNARMSEGVTPENNAVVLLWKAIGPHPEGQDSAFHREACRKLGIEPLPEEGDYLIGSREFFQKIVEKEAVAKADDGTEAEFEDPENQTKAERFEQLGSHMAQAMSTPWTGDQYPVIRQWIEANQTPLEWTAKAVQRPKYYRPIVYPPDVEENNKLLLQALLPEVQQYRVLSRLLAARAMLRLGEHNIEGAMEDLKTGHRLSQHAVHGFCMIESLIGIAIDAITFLGDFQLAVDPAFTAAHVRQYREFLHELGPCIDRERAQSVLEVGERFFSLDCTIALAQGKVTPNTITGGGGNDEFTNNLLKLAFDWNEVLRHLNSFYDAYAEAIVIKSHAEREQAFDRIADRMKNEKSKITPMAIAIQGTLGGAAGRGKMMGIVLSHLLLPAGEAFSKAVDRNLMKREILLVGLALAEYKGTHGRYPESLDQLSPDILSEVPLDLYTEKPLIYKTQEAGQRMVVYSVGENQKDDESYTFSEKPGEDTDDLRVRSRDWDFNQ